MDSLEFPHGYSSRKRSASPAMLPHSPNKRTYVSSPLAEGLPLGDMAPQRTDTNQLLERQKGLAQMKQDFAREQAIVDDMARRFQTGSESGHTSHLGNPLRGVLSRNTMQHHQQQPQQQGTQFPTGTPSSFNQVPLNVAQADHFTCASPHGTQYNMYPSYIGAGNRGQPFVAQNSSNQYSVPPNASNGQTNTGAHQFMEVSPNRLSQPPAFPVRRGRPSSEILRMAVPSNAHMAAHSYLFGSPGIDNIEEGFPDISQRHVVTRNSSSLENLNGGTTHNISYNASMDPIEMDGVKSTQSPGRMERTRSVVTPSARGNSLGPGITRRANSTARGPRDRTTGSRTNGRSRSVAPNANGKKRKSKGKAPMGSWVAIPGHIPRVQMFSELGETNFYSMAAKRASSANPKESVIQTKTKYNTQKPAPQEQTPATPARFIFIDSDTSSTGGSLTMEELLRSKGKPKGRNKSKSRTAELPSTPHVANTAKLIDLSTPAASASHHVPIVSRPMKVRLAEIPRSDTTKNPRAGSQSRPHATVDNQKKKTHEKNNEKDDQKNATREAAEKRMNAEVAELFGDDVDMTDVNPESSRRADARKLALANDRARREAQQQAAKEKRERKEQEELEQVERAKRLKEEHEAKMKPRREEERKKTAAREAAITEARREKACVNIETKRLEREAIQADLEKEKRKATEVQVEPEVIAKVKDRKEEIKKQATSHKIPKASSLVGEKGVSISSSSASGGGVDADTEESLFIARNIPPSESIATLPQRNDIERLTLNNVYDIDRRTRKAIGPTTAAEVCALAQAPKTTGYRVEREAFEAEKLAQKTQQRLNSRYKRAQSRDRETAPESNFGLPVRSQPNKQCFHLEANIENNGDKDHLVSASLFPSQLSSGGHTTVEKITKRTFSLPTNSPSARPTGSSVVCITDAERQKIQADQRRKEQVEAKARQVEMARENAKENARRKAQLKEERQAKEAVVRTEKARERKRLKIIAEAEAEGIQLSTVDIVEQVEEFMERRGNTIKRRKQKEFLKQQNENFAPDTLAIQGSFGSQSIQGSFSCQHGDLEDKEDDNEETNIRKANACAARAALDATRQGRENNFIQASNMSVEAEYDSDISEEDADPVFTPTGSEVGEDTGESEVGTTTVNTELLDGVPTDNVYGRRRTAPLHPPGENTIKIYYLMEKVSFNGVKRDSVMKNGYFNREESIRNAKILAEKYKAMPHKAYKEQTTPDDLWEAMVDFGKDSVEVFLLEGYKSTTEGPRNIEIPFDAARFDRKYYMVHKITTKITTKESVATATIYADTVDLVADMRYANQVAADLMVDFLKPPHPHLDHTIQHSEEVAPTIRQALTKFQEQGELFGVDLDMEDGGIPWMKEYTHIEFKVEEKIMKGPLN
ncbi:hypothetical protein BJ875DRAFT_547004 [Amylocarpus encephaloides]|uniref:Uncharacterized protein n=1 Tax=Amylocarpus encephaloides TaxID=45428 RepID=A0A9P8C1R1_9HELO|nr:hypothetical protein BJ875DRAFT_547004 [Amylocarpus encephaloides]